MGAIIVSALFASKWIDLLPNNNNDRKKNHFLLSHRVFDVWMYRNNCICSFRFWFLEHGYVLVVPFNRQLIYLFFLCFFLSHVSWFVSSARITLWFFLCSKGKNKIHTLSEFVRSFVSHLIFLFLIDFRFRLFFFSIFNYVLLFW